jgi:two-component system, NtrC family, sensor kinase
VIAHRRIRTQLFIALALLLVFVGTLTWTSYQGAAKFRHLTKNLHARSSELPLVAKLSTEINAQRALLSQCCLPATGSPNEAWLNRDLFRKNLSGIEIALDNYVDQLESGHVSDPLIADISEERELVNLFRVSLGKIKLLSSEQDWYFGRYFSPLEMELETLQKLTSHLPSILKKRMDNFADDARSEYHAALNLSAVVGLSGFALLGFLAWSFHRTLFHPLGALLKGTREVASGNFDYRVQIKAAGEVAELIDAFNGMTDRVQEINRDLNNQVQQRTKQVVRSEQMASVGFLAAGVAHEINNPLASIAWSAESLETRIPEILEPTREKTEEERQAEIASVKKYLRRIQDEAFRCKGITHSLLDFSRLGDAQKVTLPLADIVDSVIEMVKPLGRYRHRKIHFTGDRQLRVSINPQEIKQVVLNLITNSLDAVDDGGEVWVELSLQNQQAILRVRDNGCGMTEEVRQHLFEPFFTRRRDGQGTGLGLSISYRIIEEHGGQIEALSEGPGTGSTFIVNFPLKTHESNESIARAAA